MFTPNYKITNKINNYISDISDARAIILNAPLIPKWEIDLRKEALLRSTHASTSIEGNPLSLEEVSDLMIGREITARYKDKKEVLNYFEALSYLDNISDNKMILTNEHILHLHKIITNDVLDEPTNSGKYRNGNQYVVVGNRFTKEITFRPPATKDVPRLMNELLHWINNPKINEIHPVIEAGIIHYEFVRIHPFIDGNGRTSRAFATLILIRRGFDTKRFFTLDDFYNTDRSRYYKVLKNINPSTLDLTEWIEYFCEGVTISLKAVKDKILLLTGGKKRNGNQEQVAIDNKQIRILEFVKKQGKVTNQDVRKMLGVSNKTAYKHLEALLENKLLKRIGKGRLIFYIAG